MADAATTVAGADGTAPPVRPPAVLIGTLLTLFLAAMDSTIIGTILPNIKRSLPGVAYYPWIVSGFILATVLISPLAGRAADLFGTRRMFLAFVTVFLVGSLAAGATQTMLQLVAARAVQGLGAGGITVLAYVTFAQIFDADKRAKMQGMLSGVWGIAAILGPVVSSLITRAWSWQWVFYVNVPLCVIAVAMLRRLPSAPPSEARQFDAPGLIMVSVGILAVLLAVMLPPDSAELSWLIGLAAIAMCALGLFARHLRRHPHGSVIDIAFFVDPALRAQSIIVLASALVMYTSVTLVPQFLQEIHGDGVVQSGLVVMFAAIGWVVGASVGGQLLGKHGFQVLNTIGVAALGGGAALLAAFSKDSAIAIGYVSQVLIGLGIGQVSIASLLLAQQSLPAARIGVATANVQLLRNIGAVFGVNVFVALAMHGLSRRADELGGVARQAAELASLEAGYHRSFLGLVVVVVAAAPWLLAIPKARAAKEQVS